MPSVIDSNALQAVFAQPRPDGAFEGPMLRYFQAIGARRPILFLAFAPKVAGTYFRQAAMRAVEGSLIRAAHAQGGRDGTPYLPTVLACLLDADGPEIIMHIHMQALTANQHFIQTFGLKPTIMIRNIPDMLASFWDMLETDPVARAEGLNCLIPDNFVELNRSEKADFMIDVVAPWYASYFATWKAFVNDAPNTVCVLRYRDFCSNPATSLHAALTHAGFFVSRSKCDDALKHVWNERGAYRYNKGKQGRGEDYFLPSHFEKLMRMLSYYPQLRPWLPELMGNGEVIPFYQERALKTATKASNVA